MGIGGLGGGFNLRHGGAGAAAGDVFGDVSRQEHGLLKNEGDADAEFAEAKIAQVDAVKADGAGRGVEEAREQMEQGGFAGAAGADERGSLARMQREAYFTQGGTAVAVAEANAVELNFAPEFGGLLGTGRASGRSGGPSSGVSSISKTRRAPGQRARHRGYRRAKAG